MNNFLDDRKAKVENFKKDFRRKSNQSSKVDIPGGLFIKCEKCNEYIFSEDLEANLDVCPKCRYHFRMNARKRLSIICDNDSFNELFANIKSINPLDFPDYIEKVNKYQSETGELDAFTCGYATVNNYKVAIGVLDSHFMMGSMGSAVGEKVTRLTEYATLNKLPLIIFAASGGARMQEGIFSLMQMAKTSAAIKYHSLAGLLYVAVLTNPTTGGVAASFASLGDVIIAEKEALIGFAGQRVIKQTLREELPDGFQTAEFQLNKGFVDLVLDRKDLKKVITNLLLLHKRVDS
jgi:acetyl-CoA carboxylase carboxyl transferase subunit beta